jgi:hypothetical protein
MELKDFIGYMIYNVICKYALFWASVIAGSDTKHRHVHHLDAAGEAEKAVFGVIRGVYYYDIWQVKRISTIYVCADCHCRHTNLVRSPRRRDRWTLLCTRLQIGHDPGQL